MGAWRLNNYHPEPGFCPVQDWYDGQPEAIQGEFDYALRSFAAHTDWTNAGEISPLTGKYLGLFEIQIDIFLANDTEVQFRAIGAWRPDSSDFVLFLVSELRGDVYFPPLEEALEYRNMWSQKKGGIHEHPLI